jgi:YD repeat-containing protein
VGTLPKRCSDAGSRRVSFAAMKVTYDSHTDTLTVILREGARVAESDEDKPGVILDYDEQGNLISLELLDASRRVTDARKVEYKMTA